MEVDAYRQWDAQAQEKALERLRASMDDSWRPFYCPSRNCPGSPHDNWDFPHARPDQRPPVPPDWLVWAQIAGRGAGKTESGSRYTNKIIERVPRVVLIAPTSADLRDTVVEGVSGILATAAPGQRPNFEPSKRRLTWPNGARGLLISAEEPERLRGPQFGFAWLDEMAIYPDMQSIWDNLLFGLRMGRRPHVVITTTPRNRPLLKEILASDTTVISKASTHDNLQNLAPTFAERIIKRYEGTRLGKQELYAEFLEDVEGALWTVEMIENSRIIDAPDLDRIVVSVDPAGTANKQSDETGIIILGIADGSIYVLADRSGKYTPHGWAMVVRNAYEEFSADAVVVETNFGGDMVRHTLQTSGVDARIIGVNARRGKSLRAEPVVALFEQNKAFLLPGLTSLEEEMLSWVPFHGASPNRVDALVQGCLDLDKTRSPAWIGSPLKLVVNN